MKANFISFLCVLLGFGTVKAQVPQLQWVNQIGGKSDEAGVKAVTDRKGNTYSVGYIRDTAFFQPGSSKPRTFIKIPSATLTTSVLLVKTDPGGNFIWAKIIPESSGSASPTNLAIDGDDQLIVAGTYQGTVDFDPGPGTFLLSYKGAADIFIMKLDTNGQFLWAGSMGSKSLEVVVDLQIDKRNNIGLVCSISDTVDVDMSSGVYNLYANTPYEGAVVRLSPTGALLWAHHNKKIVPWTVAFDDSGNVYSSGSFYETQDFDFGTGVFTMTAKGAASSSDAYVLKEDSSGKFLWARSFGDYTNPDRGMTLRVDKKHHLLVAGDAGETAGDFDPGPGVINLVGSTEFIMKLDAGGYLKWVRGLNGGPSPCSFTCSGVDDSSNVYLFGSFGATTDFDPGPGTFRLSPYSIYGSAFGLCLDSGGVFKWAFSLTGTSVTKLNSASVYPNGNILLCGHFLAKTDFDPGTGTLVDSSWGGGDIFTLKLSTCLKRSSASLSECKYFNLAGHRFDSSELIDLAFITKDGCDSVVSVKMTIKPVNDSVLVSGATATAKSTTATAYQWVACPSYTPIPGATTSSYTAVMTGSYAVIVTENGCMDTSDCVRLIGTHISDFQATGLSVYPVPMEDYVLVEGMTPGAHVSCFNVLGQLLYEGTAGAGGVLRIETKNYPGGVYLLKITEPSGRHSIVRVVKE